MLRFVMPKLCGPANCPNVCLPEFVYVTPQILIPSTLGSSAMRDLKCVARHSIALDDDAAVVVWHKDITYVASCQLKEGHSDVGSFRLSAVEQRSGTVRSILDVDLVVLSADLQEQQTQIRSLTYLSDGGPAVNDEPALCLVTAGGDIVLVSLEKDESGQYASAVPQIMGSVEQGVLASQWSSDEETLILVVPALDGPSTSASVQPEKLLVMSRDFEVLGEKIIRDQGRGEEQVSVGWGSKATQFHGSAGKAAAQAQPLDNLQSNDQQESVTRPLPDDDGLPHISWRGDCAYFVITSLENVDSGVRRIIRVFDRTGALTAVSDDGEAGLTHIAAMKPTGNIIASSQRFDSDAASSGATYAKGRRHRHDIVFFERNGLRRGGFSLREEAGAITDGYKEGITEPPLPDKEARVKAADDAGWNNEHTIREVQWNSDASALAVWLRRSSSAGARTEDVVQIWTTANWHWYLKQEIRPVKTAGLRGFCWHPDQSLQLALLWARDGEAPSCLDTWSFHSITMRQEAHDATIPSAGVAVTDGGVQRVTFFDQQTVPPPMCSRVLPTTTTSVWRTDLEGFTQWPADDSTTLGGFTPRDKAWAQVTLAAAQLRPRRLNLLALLHPDGTTVYLYAFSSHSPRMAPRVSFVGKLRGSDDVYARGITLRAHSQSSSNHVRLCVGVYGEGIGRSLNVWRRWATLDVDGSGDSSPLAEKLSLASLDAPEVKTVTREADIEETTVLLGNGPVGSVWLHRGSGTVEDIFAAEVMSDNLGQPVTTLNRFCPSIQAYQTEGAPLTIGLTPDHTLLSSAGDTSAKVLAQNATSFVVSPPFLIWTNTNHEARFLPLESLVASSAEVTSEVVSLDRRVERGSRIVASVPRQMALILQMPRGNLERVFPRCMVLDRVRNELDARRYKLAFLHCREHRVDLNVLYDHNPDAFLRDVGEFIKQVNDADHLNLFLSSLRSDDVTQSLYKPLGSGPATSGSGVKDDKVNQICEAFITQLGSLQDDRRWINSILTAYVKKVPADYESALSMLRQMTDTDAAVVDAAIEYIIFLAPFDSLFDVALGMYDLTLALMVAQHSKKKDPREYLPFLRQLREIPSEDRRRFEIDDHLRRHDKALLSLIKSTGATAPDAFDEVLEYTKRHRLFGTALQACTSEPKKWRRLQGIYGDYLLGRQKWTESALAFQLAGDTPKALEAFQTAGAWQDAFALAASESMPTHEVVSLARSMASRLESTGRHAEAARVKLEYARDIEGALDSYGKANEMTECRRICAAYQRLDLVETHVKPASLQAQSTLMDDITLMADQLRKQMARLEELRTKKQEQPALFYDEEGAGANCLDNIDVQSDTSTQITQFTRYTKAPSHAGTLSSISASSRGTKTTNKKSERKMRKKEEKKKAGGKKGSVYEEDYLYESVQRLIKERLGEVQDEVAKLLPSLILLGSAHRQAALALHKHLEAFEKQAEAAVQVLVEVAEKAGAAADEARIAALTSASGANLSMPNLALVELLAGTTWLDKTAQRPKMEVAQKKWRNELLEATTSAATEVH
ncbi:unnamed protein product [Parajaminaea phylloscopi]